MHCSAYSLRCSPLAAFAFLSLVLPSSLVSLVRADELFPDKNLEAAVRREVFEKRYNAEPLTPDDVKNISQVIGKGKGIKSLEGLQNCKAIQKLDLENNEITDLNPLKELKLLQWIDLSKNKIESIEPLSQLVKVQYLQISNNGIADLSALREMSNLRSLYASDNKIKSLAAVAGLTKIWSLQIAGNPVDDAAPIGEMKGLDTINLKGCGIKSLEFVRTLRPRLLMLNGNAIADLAPLADICEADAKGDARFASFLRVYVDESILKESNHTVALERLRTAGVRINPENK